MHKNYKKVVLIVLDGFGVATAQHGNAIAQANIPVLDSLVHEYPSLTLQASGPLVGLPWGEMGNSEVGHLNLGAGRIVGQDLPRITNAISNREFFSNKVFLNAIEHAKKNNSALHLVGMVSPGGVHSLDEHVYALLGMAAENGLKKVFVHMFTDGRDTEPKVALDSLAKLREKIEQTGVGEIATIAGRFYAMDRGGHWNQTELTYQAMVNGKGPTASSAEEAVEKNYNAQIFDETIPPTVIMKQGLQPVGRISDDDAVLFINFRSDRALQLVQFFVEPAQIPKEFQHTPFHNVYFATMTEYKKGLPVYVAFESVDLKNNLPELLARNGLKQYHTAESEKYAHVTVFFNCGRSEKLPGEEREIIESPSNSNNYVDHPEMSAELLTSKLCQRITQSDTSFFLANFANSDIVGHTGNLQAAIQAVECLDKCLGRIRDAVLSQDGVLIVTADHGNIEQMINTRTGDIDKDHTTNPVPFLLIAKEFEFKKPSDTGYISLASRVPAGVICDVAPTILDLFGLPKPPEMTGVNLLESLKTEVDA